MRFRYRLRGRLLGWLYRRFGRLYPTVYIALELQLAAVVVVVGVLFLSLYVPMSASELGAVMAAAVGAGAVAFLLALVRAHRLLRPVREWIAGDRGPDATVEAWRATIAFPREFAMRVWYGAPLLGVALFTVAAALILELDALETLFVFGISWFAVGYAFVLDAFLLEVGMAPVIADMSARLPGDFEFGRAGLSLRWRLYTALPFINVLTGLVVAGLTSPDDEVASIGIDVLAATAVAFSISLVLSRRLAESLLTPLDALADAAGRVEQGDFDTRVVVGTGDEIGRLERAFNRMAAGLAERERMREAFGTYIDPDVAEQVLEHGPSLEGEEVEVTLMFVDVCDFTGFAERSEPAEVVTALNRLFDIVVPLVHEHDGHVDKFIGDGLLAVFGALRPLPDHADRALAAAREIDERVRRDGPDGLELGIGLNSGTVVAGNVGGGGRLEFSVIGDAVNVAARVEAATGQTGDSILVSEHTRARLGSQDGLVERSDVVLKGKRDEVRVFAASE